jgi:hypothetical protein
MTSEKKDEAASGDVRQASRRAFLHDGAAALAGAFLFGGRAWAAVFEVGHAAAAPPAAGIGRRAEVPSAIAQRFLNERYEFDVTFLGAKTATGIMTFAKTDRNEYTASLEASTSDLVGALTSLRKVAMTSIMNVYRNGERERFVSRMFVRKTIKSDSARETRNEFDYQRRRWSFSYYTNGVKTSGPRVRRIPPDVYYDDFVALLYNFRAQVYAPVAHGLQLTLNTLPWDRTVKIDGKKVNKSASTIGVEVPGNERLGDDDRKWLAKLGAEYLIVVNLDKDVYGIPSGQAKFAGDIALVPEGAWVENAMLFGDVRVCRRK